MQKNLENALKMRGGVVETLQVWGIQINVKPDANVHVPAYKSTFHFQFMKAADEDGEKQ
jgi:uncharacterized protein YlxW (UPF0749 family)